jgi:Ni,Fe-hydrogenase III small subunit
MKILVLLGIVLMSSTSAFGKYRYDDKWKRSAILTCLQGGHTEAYCICMRDVMMRNFNRERLEIELSKYPKSAEYFAMIFEITRKCEKK